RLKYPLLRPSPDDKGCQAAEEVSAIVQGAERSACSENQDQDCTPPRQCTPQPRTQRRPGESPLPIPEVVPRREDDHDRPRNEHRPANQRLNEPDVNEDACQDGHREWHESILPGITIDGAAM